MGYLFIIGGLLILFLTYLDYRKDETDLAYLFLWLVDWWLWFDLDINKKSFPILFWLIILSEFTLGIVIIFYGLGEL